MMSTDSYLAYYYNFIKSEDIELILEHNRCYSFLIFHASTNNEAHVSAWFFCVRNNFNAWKCAILKRLVYDAQL